MVANQRKLITSTKMEMSFISTGFSNWKDASKRFSNHENSDSHKEAVERMSIMTKCPDVSQSLETQSMNDQEQSRQALLKKYCQAYDI